MANLSRSVQIDPQELRFRFHWHLSQDELDLIRLFVIYASGIRSL